MYTAHLLSRKSIYHITLLLLGTFVLGSCGQSRQLGMDADPQVLLNEKLANPSRVLSTTESISLIEHCAQLGEQNAENTADKDVVMTLGNTGTGKSTFLNAILGCKMKLVKPGEVGTEGMTKVVIVDPESTQPEIMPIGHEDDSKTFLPQIVQNPNYNDNAYCDCPGFSDSRGAEINIANAINIKRVLQQATGVKAVFLTDYPGLLSGRANNVRAMETMCEQMFGGTDNLSRHQNAVLLGITKAPRYDEDDEPITCDLVRKSLIKKKSPTIQILANRLFLYDPLDRGHNNPDFWSLARCRTEIAQLDSIPQREATNLFQTVLTDGDQTHLKLIMRTKATALAATLEQDDYQAAGKHWQALARLKVIGSDEVETMIGEHALTKIQHHVLGCVGTFKKCAAQYQFDQAENQLDLLKMLANHFPHADLKVNLAELEALLTQCKETKRIEEESIRNKINEAEQAAARRAREEAEEAMERLVRHIQTTKPPRSRCVIL